MRHTSLLFLLLLAACADGKPEEVKFADAMPNLPIPPEASVVSRESGTDAVKVRFASALTAEAVATYYRTTLSRPPYTLVSDTRTGTNEFALYAENPGQPSLWVSISPNGNGSFVDVAGAKERPKRTN